jgi:hypothetical protein
MFMTHPSVLSDLAAQHVNELVHEANTHRLAAALRRSRRQRWPDDHLPAERGTAALRAGRLAGCELSTGQAR